MQKPLVSTDFELSNLQRQYLGLDPVQLHWEQMTLPKTNWILYFDGDVVRKIFYRDETSYYESDVLEHTADNRTILLPKTKRGKPKKLNFTALQSFSQKGIYFSYSDCEILIANYTTQTTYFQQKNSPQIPVAEWIRLWVEDSTDKDLQEIQKLKVAKRKHQKYAEGDFFAFKIGRCKWGFGRIVLDVAKRRKAEGFSAANLGLAHLMGQALYIMVYRHLSDTPDIDIATLHEYGTLPVQAIMDNHFYYGEYPIIGNRPVEPEEWEPVINLNENSQTAYLQYGLICIKGSKEELAPYLVEGKYSGSPIHSNAAIGFHLKHYDDYERIIEEDIDGDTILLSNENFKDLRKKENYVAKDKVFRILGLDPDKSYAENLTNFIFSMNKEA